jgi:hypothetical protein
MPDPKMKKIKVGVGVRFRPSVQDTDPSNPEIVARNAQSHLYNSRKISILHNAYKSACLDQSKLYKCFYTRLSVFEILASYDKIRFVKTNDSGEINPRGTTETIYSYLKGGINTGTQGKASLIIKNGAEVPLTPHFTKDYLEGEYFLGSNTWYKISRLNETNQKKVFDFFMSCIGNGEKDLFGKLALFDYKVALPHMAHKPEIGHYDPVAGLTQYAVDFSTGLRLNE